MKLRKIDQRKTLIVKRKLTIEVKVLKKKTHLRLVFRNYKPSEGKKLFMINGVMDRILRFKNIKTKKTIHKEEDAKLKHLLH